MSSSSLSKGSVKLSFTPGSSDRFTTRSEFALFLFTQGLMQKLRRNQQRERRILVNQLLNSILPEEYAHVYVCLSGGTHPSSCAIGLLCFHRQSLFKVQEQIRPPLSLHPHPLQNKLRPVWMMHVKMLYYFVVDNPRHCSVAEVYAFSQSLKAVGLFLSPNRNAKAYNCRLRFRLTAVVAISYRFIHKNVLGCVYCPSPSPI
jgi:hypothetical protein